MYKYKNNKFNDGLSCCPMGTICNGVVECYYFGIVKLDECAKCTVRKDTQIVRKGD